MTDREMLEFAAKAAGLRVGFEPNRVERGRYDLYWSHVHHRLCWHGKTAGSEYPVPVFWNPLDDDGDALRLAVRRRFHIKIFSACSSEGIDSPGFVEIWCGDYDPIHTEYVEGGDYETATRRAIVRAAAEIGRNMT